MRVCYFGTYRANYARNKILIEGLRRNGVEVVECHQALWHGVEDRVRTASGGWKSPLFWARVLQAYVLLFWRYLKTGAYDVMVVGYPGQYDVYLARILTRLRGKPLVWDILNSMYLIMLERGIAQRHPRTAGLVRSLERLACRLPNLLILDTPVFVDWFHETHQVPKERFRWVPISADDRLFLEARQSWTPRKPDGLFHVLYYGTFIPNHGVETIVQAARVLQGETGIHFELVGEGAQKDAAIGLAQAYRLQNITFTGWLEMKELVHRMLDADLCLGTFGDTLQATLTYNNKVHEAFALAKPVISAESPALPPGLKHREHLFLCPRADPQALAEAIQTLKADPVLRQRLAENGQRIFYEKYDITHVGKTFAGYLDDLLNP